MTRGWERQNAWIAAVMSVLAIVLVAVAMLTANAGAEQTRGAQHSELRALFTS